MPTTLALMDYAGTGEGGGQYVAVATSRTGRHNAVTWREEPGLGEPDARGELYPAPQLSPAEAEVEVAAKHLDELAALAESGYQTPTPTRYSRAAQHLQHLIDVDRTSPARKIGVGDEDDYPLTVKKLLTCCATRTRPLRRRRPGAR